MSIFSQWIDRLNRGWWVILTLSIYFFSFTIVIPGFPPSAAFLLGASFGGLCSNRFSSNVGTGLVFFNWIYLLISIPVFSIVWSWLFSPNDGVSLYVYTLVGTFLIVLTMVFLQRLIQEKHLSKGERAFIFLLPIASGGFHGLAAMLIGIGMLMPTLAEQFWWASIFSLIMGLFCALLSFFFGAVASRKQSYNKNPLPPAAVG